MAPIEPGSREEKNALAFMAAITGEAGYKMREPSYMTLQLVQLLELSFGESPEGVNADKKRDDVNAYLFIQSAPGTLVSRATRTFRRALAVKGREEAFEDFMSEFVEPFLLSLSPEVKADIIEQLEQLDEIEAAKVNPAPPRGQRSERSDPNS